MRILHFVALEMDFQVAFGGKPVSAHVALERPLSGVRPDVDLQRTVTSEDLAAVTAAMFEKRVVASAVVAGLRIVTARAFAVFGRGAIPELQIRGKKALTGIV